MAICCVVERNKSQSLSKIEASVPNALLRILRNLEHQGKAYRSVKIERQRDFRYSEVSCQGHAAKQRIAAI